MVWVAALSANIVHNLVLAFTGHTGIGKYDTQVLPSRIGIQLVSNPVSQR